MFGGAYLGQIALGYGDVGPLAQRLRLPFALLSASMHDAIDHNSPLDLPEFRFRNRSATRNASTTITIPLQKHNGRLINRVGPTAQHHRSLGQFALGTDEKQKRPTRQIR